MRLGTVAETIRPMMAPRLSPEEALFATSPSASRRSQSGQNVPAVRREIAQAAKAAQEEGLRYLELGDAYSASIAFKKLVELLPIAPTYALLGFSYFYMGDYLRAANILERAVKLEPRDAHALAGLGLAYSRYGKTQKAINAFRKVLSLNVQDAGIHFYLGHLYSELGQVTQAEKEYTEAINLKRDFLPAYEYLADLYLELGRKHNDEPRFQQAIGVYLGLIESNPSAAAAHNNIGVIYNELGHREEAREAFEKAATLKPDDVVVLSNLGTVYLQTGRFAEARPVWQRLVEKLQEDPEPKKRFLAQAYNNLGAVIVLEYSLQEMDSGAGDPELLRRAEETYLKAIKTDPNYVDPYTGLGVIYYRQGRADEANQAFLKALELDPNSEAANDNLRVIPLDPLVGATWAQVSALKRGTPADVDVLVDKAVEIQQRVLEEHEREPRIGVFTPEDLMAALLPPVKEMDSDTRFRLAAKLFERNLLSSGKAARLASMDRVAFLLNLHKVGVAVIDLDEEQLEDQARYVNSH